MARPRIRIPKRYILVKKDTGTIAVRNELGMFEGRIGPESKRTKGNPYLRPYHGVGDTTKAVHLKESRDYNGDGKISANERGGTIRGRTVRVRATGRARGYERRI